MISGNLIAIAFVLMILPIFLLEWLEKRRFYNLATGVLCVMSLASFYCLYAGVHLLAGWEDPLASADQVALGEASANTRRGGLVVAAVRYWPYVLILLGGYCSYNNAQVLRDKLRRNST